MNSVFGVIAEPLKCTYFVGGKYLLHVQVSGSICCKNLINLTLRLLCLLLNSFLVSILKGFPDSPVGKESVCNAGGPGLIPGWGRSPGEGNGNPLQYSYLENSMERGAWRAWTEEPGGLQSIGLQRVGHDQVTNTHTHTHTGDSLRFISQSF